MSNIQFPTFQELYDIAKSEIITKNSKLNDFNEGSGLDVHCGSSAAVGMELLFQLNKILSMFWITTAENEDLDKRLKDYNIIRKSGSYSNKQVTLVRTSSDRALIIPTNSTFATPDGVEFYNETTVTWSIGQTTTTTKLTAKLPGTSSNVSANTIKYITPTVSDTVVITHPNFDNGTDEETDSELRDRFYLELSAMARGTEQALRAGALRHVGVTNASVSQVFPGYSKLYIDAGNGSPSAELIQDVQDDIDQNWRACGEQVQVLASEKVLIDVSGTITIDPGYIMNSSSILNTVIQSVTTLLNNKKMGTNLYKSEIIKTVLSVNGVIDVQIITPVDNIAGESSKSVRAGVIDFVIV